MKTKFLRKLKHIMDPRNFDDDKAVALVKEIDEYLISKPITLTEFRLYYKLKRMI